MERCAGDDGPQALGQPLAVGRRSVLLGLAAALALGLAPAPAGADESGFFRIGTAGTAGTYFRFGGVIASLISSPPGTPACARGNPCGVPDLIAVAQATQGSVENVQLIGKNQLESALAQADITAWAYAGNGIFKSRGAIGNLRAVTALFPESVHVVVLRDSGIKTLRDLKGKRVSLGEKESGTLAEARVLLDMAGLSERDLKPDYSRLAEAANGLKEGMFDAFFLVGGYPIPAIADLAGSTPIQLLTLGPDFFDKLHKRYPYFSPSTIPADTYSGVGEATPTVGINALWIASAEVPETLAYAITKAYWSEPMQKALTARFPMPQRVALDHALDGIDIPLHPGAERFYREAGVLPDTAKQ